MTDEMRVQFEAFCRAAGIPITKNSAGDYGYEGWWDPFEQPPWNVWQAAWNAARSAEITSSESES